MSSVSFDRLLHRMWRRISDHKESQQPELVLDESALTEGEALWKAAQPTDIHNPSPEDAQRMTLARHALGWLHAARFAARPANPDLVDLARAFLYLAPLAEDPNMITAPMPPLIGPGTDVRFQAHAGVNLINLAATNPDPDLLDAGIGLLTTALAADSESCLDRAALLATLCVGHLVLFARDEGPADLDGAIAAGEQAVAATPDKHSARAGRSSTLAAAYERRFHQNGEVADLDRAIELRQQALHVTPVHDPGRTIRLSELENACRTRLRHVDVTSGLDWGIQRGEEIVTTTPESDPGWLRTLLGLLPAYQMRFATSGRITDLDRMIQLGERLLTVIPNDHPHRRAALIALGTNHWQRFELTGAPPDLDCAIGFREQAISTPYVAHPDRWKQLNDLAATYLKRFSLNTDTADLNRAINLGEQALTATPDSSKLGKQKSLSTLALAYQMSSSHSGVAAESERAIDLAEQALTLFPEEHPDRPKLLTNLADTYLKRFQRNDATTDLERAIDLGEQALTATPDGHPDRAVMLTSLATAYQARYERRGATTDIDQAISLGKQVLTIKSKDDPLRRAALTNLCLAYWKRYRHVGVSADLERAIEVGEQALTATPDNHPDRASPLTNLGLAYRERFERRGEPADLERAIDVGEQALAATPDNHPHTPRALSNLSGYYRQRYRWHGAIADLERAIDLGEQALAGIADDHPNRAMGLWNLSVSHHDRFEHTGVAADLNTAIQLGEQAVAATADHPSHAATLSSLARAYRSRLDANGQGISRDKLRDLVRQVNNATIASAVDRILAGRDVGSLADALHEHQTAAELFDTAVALLPSVAAREGDWSDQEHRLGEHLGLVSEAIAAHCALDDPVGAVEIAELGRGVLLATRLGTSTDLTDLDHVEPDLAAQLRGIHAQLDERNVTGDQADDSSHRTTRRGLLWAEHDEVLTRIRQHPRFTRFQLPPRLADLSPSAAGGAVLMVNAASQRSDAIIVTAAADPILVPLPDLTLADVRSASAALLAITHSSTNLATVLRRPRLITEILVWLWETTVGPILESLPSSLGSDGGKPRVWWMPTGTLGLFPLHGAGQPGQPGALDRVISSYIPTMRALTHIRRRPPAKTRRQLTVALPHTPGLPDLPGTAAEVLAVHARHPDTPLLTDRDATIDNVRNALQDATWAHFACHASTDLTAPSRGGLQLYDGTLPIPHISALRLTDAELAYLSACSTANRGIRHAEESIHLASAFQLAGFRHVVASLWPLDDHTAAVTAQAFYDHLPTPASADHAAAALNDVTRDLRALHPNRPDLWAALIHSGPHSTTGTDTHVGERP